MSEYSEPLKKLLASVIQWPPSEVIINYSWLVKEHKMEDFMKLIPIIYVFN